MSIFYNDYIEESCTWRDTFLYEIRKSIDIFTNTIDNVSNEELITTWSHYH